MPDTALNYFTVPLHHRPRYMVHLAIFAAISSGRAIQIDWSVTRPDQGRLVQIL